MQIKVNDKFLKSLESIRRREMPINRIYYFFRTDLPRFFKNVWYFRKEMLEFSWWDFRFNLTLFRKSLEFTRKGIEEMGMEVDETRLKKVSALQELISIMKTIESDDFIALAEKELGEIKVGDFEFIECEDRPGSYEMVQSETPEERHHASRVFIRASQIEEEYWDRMVRIIRGQSHEALSKDREEYDGTGMRGWWD